MNRLPLILIATILLIFVESFFNYLGGVSIAVVLLLLTYHKVNSYYLLIPIIAVTLSLDISNHLFTGTTLAVFLFTLLIVSVWRRTLPYENNIIIKGLSLLLTFTLFHMIYSSVFYIGDNQFFETMVKSDTLRLSIRNSIFETALYLAIDYVTEYMITSKNSVFKIK